MQTYTFSARLGNGFSVGEIARSDGESVTVCSREINDILLDMAVDDEGCEGDARHHRGVLVMWFQRKSAKRQEVMA